MSESDAESESAPPSCLRGDVETPPWTHGMGGVSSWGGGSPDLLLQQPASSTVSKWDPPVFNAEGDETPPWRDGGSIRWGGGTPDLLLLPPPSVQLPQLMTVPAAGAKSEVRKPVAQHWWSRLGWARRLPGPALAPSAAEPTTVPALAVVLDTYAARNGSAGRVVSRPPPAKASVSAIRRLDAQKLSTATPVSTGVGQGRSKRGGGSCGQGGSGDGGCVSESARAARCIRRHSQVVMANSRAYPASLHPADSHSVSIGAPCAVDSCVGSAVDVAIGASGSDDSGENDEIGRAMVGVGGEIPGAATARERLEIVGANAVSVGLRSVTEAPATLPVPAPEMAPPALAVGQSTTAGSGASRNGVGNTAGILPHVGVHECFSENQQRFVHEHRTQDETFVDGFAASGVHSLHGAEELGKLETGGGRLPWHLMRYLASPNTNGRGIGQSSIGEGGTSLDLRRPPLTDVLASTSVTTANQFGRRKLTTAPPQEGNRVEAECMRPTPGIKKRGATLMALPTPGKRDLPVEKGYVSRKTYTRAKTAESRGGSTIPAAFVRHGGFTAKGQSGEITSNGPSVVGVARKEDEEEEEKGLASADGVRGDTPVGQGAESGEVSDFDDEPGNGSVAVPSGNAWLSRRQSARVSFANEFQYLIALSRKCHLPIHEVRRRREEFNVLASGKPALSIDDFMVHIRSRCGLDNDAAVPEPLVRRLSLRNLGEVNFEEYLVWCQNTAYIEDMLVTDPKERHLRQLARVNGYLLLDVEKVKGVFDRFDTDKSDAIDEEEFGHVIRVLMKVKNPADISDQKMKRFWTEVDCDGSGEICFEEFLMWYFKFMTAEP
eukprot:TRINITY_DN37455_c0_g1_i1.p1 TRINITY_DN37455_c0_g1~~TRINITY_DN37455_c0_g1_i1.p1  ORF type:complete len:833 (+),score=124.71 TRINITY_DN37455_c0_g1_i1:313-2811(+)